MSWGIVISQSGDVMKKLSRRHTDFGDVFFLNIHFIQTGSTCQERHFLIKAQKKIQVYDRLITRWKRFFNISIKETLVMKKIKIFRDLLMNCQEEVLPMATWRLIFLNSDFSDWKRNQPHATWQTCCACWVFFGGKCGKCVQSIIETFKNSMFWHTHTHTHSLCVKRNRPQSPIRTWDWMKFWAEFEIKLVSYPQSQRDTVGILGRVLDFYHRIYWANMWYTHVIEGLKSACHPNIWWRVQNIYGTTDELTSDTIPQGFCSKSRKWSKRFKWGRNKDLEP